MTSNYGLLNGLAYRAPDQSKYVLAAYQQKQAKKAAQQKADDALMKNLNDFISNENKDINPVHAPEAKEASVRLAAKYLKGKETNPNYANDVGFMQDRQDFTATMNLLKLSSKNMGGDLEFQSQHPKDWGFKDNEIRDAILSGDATRYHAAMAKHGSQNGYYQVGFGLKGIPNFTDWQDLVTKGASKGQQPVTEYTGRKNNTDFYQTKTPVDQTQAEALARQLAVHHDEYGMTEDEIFNGIMQGVPKAVNFVQDRAAVYHAPQGSKGITFNAGTYSGNGKINGSVTEDATKTYIAQRYDTPSPDKDFILVKLKDGTSARYLAPTISIDKKTGAINAVGEKMVAKPTTSGATEWVTTGETKEVNLTKEELKDFLNNGGNVFSINGKDVNIDPNNKNIRNVQDLRSPKTESPAKEQNTNGTKKVKIKPIGNL